MSREDLMKNLEEWHNNNEYQKIIDALESLPLSERDYELTGLLARAYSNLGEIGDVEPYEKSIELLLSTKEEGQTDPKWNFRMGYALYYLDKEKEAIPYFEKIFELIPNDLENLSFWYDARVLLTFCKKTAEIPPSPDILQFDNTCFKLAVVQNLMYEQELLTPKFDLRTFAKYCLTREIDVDAEENDIIPEAFNWFYMMDIPASLAPFVTELNMNGGNELYRHIFPMWGGRRVFSIDELSEKELAQFPNLKKMTLCTDQPEVILPMLKDHGIEASLWHIRSTPCK